MALSLGPLRNFLNERAECFPQLLRLEERLALLDHQSPIAKLGCAVVPTNRENGKR